jgi:integrase
MKVRPQSPGPVLGPDNLKRLFKNREPQKSRKHHAAMAFEDLPELMIKLRSLDSVSARALELTILCAIRTSETRFATWGEMDFEEKVWCIPATRMKMGEEHEIPLSDRAIAILRAIKPGKQDKLIFNGAKNGEPLSDQALLQCLRGLTEGVTTRGMRSAFRDWCGDMTSSRRICANWRLPTLSRTKRTPLIGVAGPWNGGDR